jgi:hypothetical protein
MKKELEYLKFLNNRIDEIVVNINNVPTGNIVYERLVAQLSAYEKAKKFFKELTEKGK